MDATRKSSLSAPCRRLLALFQLLNFGRLENLVVRNGEPCFEPHPRVLRDIKIGGDNRPRPESCASDFDLKSQVVEFFDELARVRSGVVLTLTVRHGLPVSFVLEETDAAERIAQPRRRA